MVVKFLGLEEGKGGKVGKVKRWKRVRRRKMLKGKSLKCLKLSEVVSYLLVFQARTLEAGVCLKLGDRSPKRRHSAVGTTGW